MRSCTRERTRLRVYRFEPGAVFEGGLVGAVERMQLSGDAKLLDARFVTRDAASGALAAVDLATAGTDGTFASMLDFRLDARRRRAITDRTLGAPRGCAAAADRGDRRHASVDARALAQVGSQPRAAAVSATPR